MIIIFLSIGVMVGLLSGLLGIGGGIILVPSLKYVFEHQSAIPHSLSMHTAVATSLAVILLTSARTSWLYIRQNLFLPKLFIQFVPGLILGTLSGVMLGQHIHGQRYTQIFSIFLFLLALQLIRPSQGIKPSSRFSQPYWRYLMSFVTGHFSALFGIGGGVLMTPYFTHIENNVLKAIGTSTLCTLPIALTSTLFMQLFYKQQLQINWLAVAIIGIGSMLCAPVGAKLARQISERRLKLIFSCVLTLVALKMLLD